MKPRLGATKPSIMSLVNLVLLVPPETMLLHHLENAQLSRCIIASYNVG